MKEKNEPKFKRRELLSGTIASLTRRVGSKARGIVGIEEERFVRPPGALHEDLFLLKCSRCDACAAACQTGAIRVYRQHDNENDGTPMIVPADKACEMCGDPPPCVSACETGALSPSEDGNYKIGVAQLISANCLVNRGGQCSYCVDYCPKKDAAIFQYASNEKPVVYEASCTGCGVCEYYCPARPKAIYVKPK